MDLIFAEATPPGRGGVSVFRISGDNARRAAERLAGSLAHPRHAYLREIRDGDEILDQGLVLWFEAGRSFTGEEVAEIHLHGAPVIGRRLNQILVSQGLRLAEAGEFTRRAFLNGKMNLPDIEGLGDLLSAETESQRRLALRSSTGELARKANEWRQLLTRAGALVESSIDFADEDVPEEVPSEVYDLLNRLQQDLQEQIRGFAAAERIRNGFEVAIVGPPNAGKSSLLNRIAKRDVALVSEVEGTTRDIIELRLDLFGLAVTFLDTAGLRDSEDEVEVLGIDRARSRARAADLRVHLSTGAWFDPSVYEDGDLVVASKADLRDAPCDLSVSVVTGEGIENLLKKIFSSLSDRVSDAALVSHQRQLDALVQARSGLDITWDLPPEMLAESIRATAQSLDRFLGKIDSEDYLDIIFSSFCIGK